VKLRKGFLIKCILGVIVLSSIIECVDPADPEFELKEGLIFVDAFVSTTPQSSFVTITESVFSFDRLVREFVSGASVQYRNTDTNQLIALTEQEGTYLPPMDFVGVVGESWELQITLADGREYRSQPERIIPAVEIVDVRSNFNPDLVFRPTAGSFVPGHSISVDFDDPPGEENFYFWSFRSFERLIICKTCENSIFRNGECEPNDPDADRQNTYDYRCESSCWFIRTNENIKIFDDEFTNGRSINNLPIADVVLFSNQNIVVQIQQFSLTASAYEFYRVLQDLVDNTAGINAPPPAALIGNMFNPNDDTEFVLGRFTAAPSTTRNIFIDRSDIQEPPLDNELFIFESCNEVCPPIACPPFFDPLCRPVLMAPCEETRFKTSITPEGWINLN